MDSECQTEWPAENSENFDADDEPIPTPSHEQEYIKMLESILAKKQSEISEKRELVKNLKSDSYRLMHQYNLKCEQKRNKNSYG